MRGHEGIIRLRLAKLRPEAVFINDYPCDTNWEDFGDAPTVCIHGDDPEALDWRYLVGLTVFIHGSSEQRARELFELAIGAGAETVVCAHTYTKKDYMSAEGLVLMFKNGERHECH